MIKQVIAKEAFVKAAAGSVAVICLVATIGGAYCLGRAANINLTVQVGQVDFFITTAEAQTEVKKFVAAIDESSLGEKGAKADTKAPPKLPEKKGGNPAKVAPSLIPSKHLKEKHHDNPQSQ